MGQARDSLQAYITAVYFDITHTATWTDLGLLYESCGHLVYVNNIAYNDTSFLFPPPPLSLSLYLSLNSDSLLCYKNGLAGLDKKGGGGGGGEGDGKSRKPAHVPQHDSVTEMLMSRLTFVEQHIQQTGGLAVHSSRPRQVILYGGRGEEEERIYVEEII